jgi:hypothetical protein
MCIIQMINRLLSEGRKRSRPRDAKLLGRTTIFQRRFLLNLQLDYTYQLRLMDPASSLLLLFIAFRVLSNYRHCRHLGIWLPSGNP